MQKDDCLFCKISRGEVSSTEIYRDDVCYAIMDLFPSHYGHVLVIPHSHYENYIETEDQVLAHLIVVAKKVALAQEKVFHNEGSKLIINCKEVGNQKIFHTHLHLLPHYINEAAIKKEPLEEQGAKLRVELSK